MNTSGMARGYMAKNMEAERFVEVVASALGREFKKLSEVCKQDRVYLVKLESNYRIELSEEDIKKLMKKSPYALDKYIIEKFMEQGLEVDMNRSQYIEYCFIS